jgi:hypothetical protein
MTDTIVFLDEPGVRLCKKVRSKWSGKLVQNELTVFYIYKPMLNIGTDVYNFGRSRIENVTSWQNSSYL